MEENYAKSLFRSCANDTSIKSLHQMTLRLAFSQDSDIILDCLLDWAKISKGYIKVCYSASR